MRYKIHELPPNVLALMTDEQRLQLGLLAAPDHAGGVPSGEEDTLQADIRVWLLNNRIQFINPPMFQKSALPPGWPDFTFCFKGRPYAIECKTKTGRVEKGQALMHSRLLADGWNVAVVRSFAHFLEVIGV